MRKMRRLRRHRHTGKLTLQDVDVIARFLHGDLSMMKCAICGAAHGTCSCWIKCRVTGCKWSYRSGEHCNNPDHAGSKRNKIAKNSMRVYL